MNLKPRIFCFWTDSNLMSDVRNSALSSITNTQLQVIFVDNTNLSSWVLDSAPLHPAYKYLSSVHKADYLRCYFMHYFGGGYSDIKVLENSWLQSYKDLKDSDNLINGYKEVNCFETARGRGILKDCWLALNFFRVIGNGAFICKSNTSFTSEWLHGVNKVLDQKYKLLVKNPAQDPRDFYLKVLNDGTISNYPLNWSEILGGVFHPLCLKYSKQVLQTLPTPDFSLKYL
jgi:hypothetical protein